MEGYIPAVIDHINGKRADNRFINLRSCTTSENIANSKVPSNNLLGIKGVRYHRQGCYKVSVTKNKVVYTKHFTISNYPSKEKALEEAVKYAKDLRQKLHGEFANHG